MLFNNLFYMLIKLLYFKSNMSQRQLFFETLIFLETPQRIHVLDLGIK